MSYFDVGLYFWQVVLATCDPSNFLWCVHDATAAMVADKELLSGDGSDVPVFHNCTAVGKKRGTPVYR